LKNLKLKKSPPFVPGNPLAPVQISPGENPTQYKEFPKFWRKEGLTCF